MLLILMINVGDCALFNEGKRFAFALFCRLMKAQALGDTSSLEFMRGRRILEINPDHPIIKDLNVRQFYSANYTILNYS